MSLLDRFRTTVEAESFDTPRVQRLRKTAPTVHVVGLSLLFLIPGLLVALVIEWGSNRSHDEAALLLAIAVATIGGLALWFPTEPGNQLSTSSVFSSVAFSWIACSLVGALPYAAGSMFEWRQFDSALFEAVSGFSATGSTVLSDIEANGAGILMWRQITQFYGGMGMVVLAVTVLPALGVGGLALMTAEAPGTASDRLAPRVTETARTLWKIYLGVTVVVALLLWLIPGPSLYDAFAHALTTSSTGGFSPYNSSVGHFDSWLVESVIVVGLFLCGMNFALHYRALRGDVRGYARSSDTRAYVAIIVGAIVVATLVNWLVGVRDTAGNALDVTFAGSIRDSTFNVVTLASSGGFGNARGADSLGNFVLWAPQLQIMLLLIMVIGGSVGSTAGGAKVFRAEVAFKHSVRAIRRIRHPRGVLPIKLGEQSVPNDIVHRVIGFLTTFLLITVLGAMVIAATGAPVLESISASISAMSNMGPALGDAGPTSNFLVFSRPARAVLTVLMMIGRLELFAVLLMFATPSASIRDARARRQRRRARRSPR